MSAEPGGGNAAPLRVLCLEDVPQDAELVCAQLRRAGFTLSVDIVDDRDGFVAALASGAYDIVLADHKLPGFDAHAALQIAQERADGIPFIVVSGTIGEEAAVALLKQGATDYVIKDRLERLPSAVQRALDEAALHHARLQAEAALLKSEAKFRHMAEQVADVLFTTDAQGGITYVSPSALTVFGWSPEEMIGHRFVEFLEESAIPEALSAFRAALASGEPSRNLELAMKRRDGSVFDGELNGGQISAEHDGPGTIGLIRDITERKRAEEALRASEERYRALFSGMLEGFAYCRMLYDEAGRAVDWIYLAVNDAFERLTGLREVVGKRVLEAIPDIKESNPELFEIYGGVATTGRPVEFDLDFKPLAMWMHLSVFSPAKDHFVAVFEDITERKQVEQTLAAGAVRLRATLHDTVRAMGAIVELRDPYTGEHERRAALLAEAIAVELGLDESRREGLRLAGEVHDVGKIGVPAEILSKPGRLTEIEFSLVQQHAGIGGEILAEVAFEWPVAEIVRQHHERLDGSGYPRRLQGETILLEARILAVADVVEAMASHRPHRPALGIQAALDEVRSGAGTRYDAAVAAACERVIAAGFDLDE